jgi:hypothetical protein
MVAHSSPQAGEEWGHPNPWLPRLGSEALLYQADCITRLDWTGVPDGGVDSGSTLVRAVQEFHQRKKRSHERVLGIVGDETAPRVALSNKDRCR